MEDLEALYKPLSGANGSEPSHASEAVTGRDVIVAREGHLPVADHDLRLCCWSGSI